MRARDQSSRGGCQNDENKGDPQPSAIAELPPTQINSRESGY